jgi:hypothetical protein
MILQLFNHLFIFYHIYYNVNNKVKYKTLYSFALYIIFRSLTYPLFAFYKKGRDNAMLG